ncbi:DNA-binding response OmpR family regulator [Nocardioides salarius]|uniref:DNA-binding response OmpR family regulator n=1 Tax=Nocardioides salarius TaxID=374513 RepID=A0ABS2MGL9_9ACTN|nr:response regulator transcription factor [Nocardioides salarius]MBM7510335.1 DNA-binding response OmpR family regulator [Nocardioides salarius]
MSGHRALVVEDDPDIRHLLVTVLEDIGIAVVTAGTGAEAVAVARANAPDLITLDLTLPDADGTDVCRELRGFTDAYIVMITGRDSEIDRLVGLEVGADEYLAKPFSPRELRARAVALLRRPRAGADQQQSGSVAPQGQEVLQVGDLRIDAGAGHVRLGDDVVLLTPTEVQVLRVLASRPGTPWPRTELAAAVWDGDFVESGFLVDVQVAGVRRKLRAVAGREWVRAVDGVAYQLTPPTS